MRGRKKIPESEKKGILTIMIENKFLTNQNKDELREIAYNAIISHVTNEKTK